MSQEISAEEKKRILRERRQAKMAKGQATSRLNEILSQGSSIKADPVVSVIDKARTAEATSAVTTGTNSGKEPTATSSGITTTSHDDDPAISDISTVESPLISTPAIDTPPIDATEDIDAIFNKVFGANANIGAPGGQNGPAGFGGAGQGEDPFSQMMMNMLKTDGTTPEPFADNVTPEEMKYRQDLAAYNSYQLKVWKFRFLAVRIVSIVLNFAYHYFNFSGFKASSHSYIRGIIPTESLSSFITIFMSIEAVILSCYYIVSSKQKYSGDNSNNLILKLLGWAAMVLPQVNAYKPLIVQMLGYYEILAMLIGDISLVVVLFGLTSL